MKREFFLNYLELKGTVVDNESADWTGYFSRTTIIRDTRSTPLPVHNVFPNTLYHGTCSTCFTLDNVLHDQTSFFHPTPQIPVHSILYKEYA